MLPDPFPLASHTARNVPKATSHFTRSFSPIPKDNQPHCQTPSPLFSNQLHDQTPFPSRFHNQPNYHATRNPTRLSQNTFLHLKSGLSSLRDLSATAGGGFFFTCKDLGRVFDHAFPTCAFFFFFKWILARAH